MLDLKMKIMSSILSVESVRCVLLGYQSTRTSPFIPRSDHQDTGTQHVVSKSSACFHSNNHK